MLVKIGANTICSVSSLDTTHHCMLLVNAMDATEPNGAGDDLAVPCQRTPSAEINAPSVAAIPVGQSDPQSRPRIPDVDGTPALDDDSQFPTKISAIPPAISPIYDVKMDGPDLRISEGYKNFLEYQGTAKHMLTVGEATKEDLQKAARDNVAFAFNEGYLKPLSNPTTPPAVKKQITDALLERAHGKVDSDVNVKLSGAIGVVTIGSEDIARLIAAANERAANGDKAVVISE